MNFQEQSQVFLAGRTARNRNPIKPSTLATYKSRIDTHILPAIGPKDLESFGNGAMREFARGLTANGLSPKTVLEVVLLVQLIVASAISEDGDRLYDRKWNFEFLDLPPVEGQKQPVVTLEQLKAALADEQYGLFYAFLAGTGMRIGEALACRLGTDGVHTAWSPDRSLVDVQSRLWRDTEGLPKTLSGIREIDLSPSLNTRLGTHVSSEGIKPGSFLFRGLRGKRLAESTIRKHSLTPLGIPGFHSFRRFRVTHLRGVEVPDELIRYWVGHTGKGMLDLYSKLAQNVAIRKEWAEKAGLGFTFKEARQEGK